MSRPKDDCGGITETGDPWFFPFKWRPLRKCNLNVNTRPVDSDKSNLLAISRQFRSLCDHEHWRPVQRTCTCHVHCLFR
jgi:hypothetical protein